VDYIWLSRGRGGILLVPIVGRVSNCGGNSAALSNCRFYAQGMLIIADNDSSQVFNIMQASGKERMLEMAADTGWIGDGEYLVRTGDIAIGENEDTVVIVCSKPFTNVPRRTWRSNPPMHAAGLANGSAVLISLEEFSKLDLNHFAPVATLKERLYKTI